MVYSEVRLTACPVNYPNRDIFRKLMVDTGILLCSMKSPSRECKLTFYKAKSYCDFQTELTFNQFPNLDTELGVVSMQHLQRVWHFNRESLPFPTPGSIAFCDLLMLQLLKPVFLSLPCRFPTFHLEYPSVLSRCCFSHRLL